MEPTSRAGAAARRRKASGARQKLGMFKGVFVPTMCSTLGVVVFLRMGFVVGQAGFGLAVLMVCLGFAIASLTMRSLIELLGGDGEGEGEGAAAAAAAASAEQQLRSPAPAPPQKQADLFSVLRSHLGPNLGDTIGLVLFVTYTMSTAFYTLGFAEAARGQFGTTLSAEPWARSQVLPWNPAGSWISSLIGTAALLLLMPFVLAGTEVSVRLSLAILCMIALSLLLALGFMCTASTDPQDGHTAFNLTTLASNWAPDFVPFAPSSSLPPGGGGGGGAQVPKNPSGFWVVFSIFFPGFTGVLGGANLNFGAGRSEIAQPKRAFSRGVRLATATTFLIYLTLALVMACTVQRDKLQTNLLVMETIVDASGVPVVFIGVCAATLSSALAYLIGAPRVLQALADGGTMEWLAPFRTPRPRAPVLPGGGGGADGGGGSADGAAAQPVLSKNAVFATWLLVQLALLTGTVDLMAPVVTGLFLLTFCVINTTSMLLTFRQKEKALGAMRELAARSAAGRVTVGGGAGGGEAGALVPAARGRDANERARRERNLAGMAPASGGGARNRSSSPESSKELEDRVAAVARARKKRLRTRFLSLLGLLLSFGAMFTSVDWWLAVLLGLAGSGLLWWRRQPLADAIRERREAEHLRLKRKHELLSRALSDPSARQRRGAVQHGEAAAGGGGGGGGGGATERAAPHEMRHDPGWLWRAVGELGELEEVGSAEVEADLQRVGREERVLRAAMFVRDALRGRFQGAAWGAGASGRARVQAKRLFNRLHVLRHANLGLYLALPFFERPSWCVPKTSCVNQDGLPVPVSNLPVLPAVWGALLELLVISLFCVEMVLKRRYLGTARFFRDPWHVVQLLLLTAALAAALVAMCGGGGGSLTSSLVLPLLRPMIFVVLSRRVRNAFVSLLRVVPAFADCVLLLTLLVGFFSMLGLLLFDGTAEGEAQFSDLPTGALSLLVLLTTANFPDVMLPAYRAHRASCLFFIVFLLLGLFFLMNLVLATIYNAYRKQLEDNMLEFAHRRRESLHVAFGLLDLSNDGYVEVSEVESLLGVLEVEGMWSGEGGGSKLAAAAARQAAPSASIEPSTDFGDSDWNSSSSSSGSGSDSGGGSASGGDSGGDSDGDGSGAARHALLRGSTGNRLSSWAQSLLPGAAAGSAAELEKRAQKRREKRRQRGDAAAAPLPPLAKPKMSKGERADLDATRAMLHQLVHMGQASERRGLAFESFSYIFSSARLQHLREQRERDKAEERAKLQHKKQLLRERQQQQQQQQQQQLSPLLRQGAPGSISPPPVGRGRSQSGAEPRAGAGHGHKGRQDSMSAAFFAAQTGSFFGRSSFRSSRSNFSSSNSARGSSSQLDGAAEFASPLLGRVAGARPRRTLKWRVLIARKLRFVRTSRFDAVVDFIIVLNAVLLFDTMGTSTGQGDDDAAEIMEDDERAQRVEEAFVVLYLLELLVKLLANGPRRFFRSKMNCFDALIIVATTLLEYGWATSSLSAESDGQRQTTLRLALVLRLLRLLRVLVALKRFNRIFATFVSLLPAFGTMFGMLWAIFNFFAEVGIGYFGGEVYVGAQALNGTNATKPCGSASADHSSARCAGGRAFAALNYEVRWAGPCC